MLSIILLLLLEAANYATSFSYVVEALVALGIGFFSRRLFRSSWPCGAVATLVLLSDFFVFAFRLFDGSFPVALATSSADTLLGFSVYLAALSPFAFIIGVVGSKVSKVSANTELSQ